MVDQQKVPFNQNIYLLYPKNYDPTWSGPTIFFKITKPFLHKLSYSGDPLRGTGGIWKPLTLLSYMYRGEF